MIYKVNLTNYEYYKILCKLDNSIEELLQEENGLLNSELVGLLYELGTLKE